MSILGGSIPGTPSFRNEQKGLNIPGKSSEPSLIQRLDLISKKSADVGVSILGGTVRLQYWESILQDSVRASVIFTDTGNTLPRKKLDLEVVSQVRLVLLRDYQLKVVKKLF